MSNQVEITATIALRPEAVEVIQFLRETRYIDEPVEKERWQQTAERFPIVAKYAQNDRADRIPYGTYGSFENEDILAGLVWGIACSTSNYSDELEAFLGLLPKIATAAEVKTECDEGIRVNYEMKGGAMVEISRCGRYEGEPLWGYGFGR